MINPKLAEEVELGRPARSIGERLFRGSLFYFVFVATLSWVLRLFGSEEYWERKLGIVGHVLGVTLGLSFFYMINYMALRFTRNRWVKAAWFSLMGFIALLIATHILWR